MELLYRVLGGLIFLQAFLSLGQLSLILREDTEIDLPRVQWGLKTFLWLVEIALLVICGFAGVLLEPIAHVFAWLALLAYLLTVFSNTVALEGPVALLYAPPAFYALVACRSAVAGTLWLVGRGL